MHINTIFNKFSHKFSLLVGSPITLIIAIVLFFIWCVFGPISKYSNAWQLVCNTVSTIATTFIVLIIQNSQNRIAKEHEIKINELIVALQGARNEVAILKNLSDKELDELEKEIEQKAVRNRLDNQHQDHNV